MLVFIIDPLQFDPHCQIKVLERVFKLRNRSFYLTSDFPAFVHAVVKLNIRLASPADDHVPQSCLLDRKRIVELADGTGY